MKKLSLAVLAAVAISTQAMADYGSAGCGLGSMVFGSEKGFIQLLAATTNGTSASQTFGITSGTSNCGSGGAAPTVKAYIEVNRETLANDISRGQGETLNNLSQLMGCTKTNEVGPALQKNYKTIFPTTKVSANEIEGSIRTAVQGHCS